MERSIEVKKSKLQIKEVRKRLGMTQAEFATKLRVRRETVSAWENGRDIPAFLEDALIFYDLLKEINCSYDDVAIPSCKKN
jgi:DNA-binding transcriptional regulator YiaG